METSNSDASSLDSSASISSPRVNGGISRTPRFPFIRLLQSPILSLLEYYGVLRDQPDYPYSEALPLMSENSDVNYLSVGNIQGPSNSGLIDGDGDVDGTVNNSNSRGEVSIRIIGDQDRVGVVNSGDNGEGSRVGSSADEYMVTREGVNVNEGNSSSSDSNSNNQNMEASAYQRYDIQQVARWVEQILPFSLLLLVVFIRQHFQDATRIGRWAEPTREAFDSSSSSDYYIFFENFSSNPVVLITQAAADPTTSGNVL